MSITIDNGYLRGWQADSQRDDSFADSGTGFQSSGYRQLGGHGLPTYIYCTLHIGPSAGGYRRMDDPEESRS